MENLINLVSDWIEIDENEWVEVDDDYILITDPKILRRGDYIKLIIKHHDLHPSVKEGNFSSFTEHISLPGGFIKFDDDTNFYNTSYYDVYKSIN